MGEAKSRKKADSAAIQQERILKGKGKGSKGSKGTPPLPTTCNDLNLAVTAKLIELDQFIVGSQINDQWVLNGANGDGPFVDGESFFSLELCGEELNDADSCGDQEYKLSCES